jgi:hypothetical protein
MHTSPPPDPELLRKAESLTGWLIGQLTELLAPGYLTTRVQLLKVCRHFLIPAETTLRRLIHLIAARLPEPQAPKRNALLPRSRGRCPEGAEGGQKHRAPLFRLTEPLPGGRGPRSAKPDRHAGPRIRNFDDPIPRPPPPRPTPDFDACRDRLLRRLAALEAAFADPYRAARRLKRLEQRLAPERPVLSLWRIPGYQSRPITDDGRAVLDGLNLAVAQTRTVYHNSS